MSSKRCESCGAENAVQKQGPECFPGYGRRSYNQCTACGKVSDMQEHKCSDNACRVHNPA